MPPERVASNGDPIGSNEALRPQPGKGRQLILQMVCRQKPNQSGGAGRSAALPFGRVDLIADIRPSRRTEALAPSVGSEEHPAMRGEYWTEGFECVLAEHAWRASVVVNDSWKWPYSFRLEHHSVKGEPSAGKRDDIRLNHKGRGHNQRKDQQ